jgi:hypothetical protein
MPVSIPRTSAEKAFAITMSFEGDGGYASLSGNFDGEGISFGCVQFNLGQGTLQPVLLDMQANGPATFAKCFTQHVALFNRDVDLSGEIIKVCHLAPSDAVVWAKSMQDSKGDFLKSYDHWEMAFKALATIAGFNAVQRKHAGVYMDRAKAYMSAFGFKSERALCLLFDICIQMGSISLMSKARYHAASIGQPNDEPSRLIRLAKAVTPQGGKYSGDVLARKLCIAAGSGLVHGHTYDLQRDFGVTDGPVIDA